MLKFQEVKFSKDLRFKPLTFSIPESQIVALYGPAKTGKTACLLAMVGGIKPITGAISVLGLNPIKRQREVRQKVGLSFIEGVYEPYFSLSVYDNFKFQGAILGKKVTKEELEKLLTKVDANFTERDIIADLNQVQRLKVGIALALLGNPEIVLIDEPFKNLTCVEQKYLEKILTGIKEEGKLVVYTTLKEKELEIADLVLDIARGGVSYELFKNCSSGVKTAS